MELKKAKDIVNFGEALVKGFEDGIIENVCDISTEELRDLKKVIEAELSRRHKAKEEEKCNCWTCGHCFYDKNAHTTYRYDRGDYKCMAYGKKGRIIMTKHKAPAWCPIMKGER